MKNGNIAIFGGSFDPIHNGHIEVIKKIIELKRFNRIIVIPSKLSPFKEKPYFSDKKRMEFLETTLSGLKIEISDRELKRNGKSYTIDTVEEIQNEFKPDKITLIIGTDLIDGLNRWHRIDDLVKYCDFLIITRKGFQLKKDFPNGIRTEVYECDIPDISSSEIRNMIKTKANLNGYIPNEILNKVLI